jgi:hypothetical protein
MNKIVVLLAAVVLFASCQKNGRPPLEYNISNNADDSTIKDIYIPLAGTFSMPVLVKFLSGEPKDSLRLVLSGLPKGITVNQSSFDTIPTYTANFVLSMDSVAQGTYPVTLTAYTITRLPQTYNFNLVVIPVDCASLFSGNLNVSNACSVNYNYSAAGTSGGYGILYISNLGGYGTYTSTEVVFNCDNDSVSVPYQNIGNGVTLSGRGIFNNNTLTISYSAQNVPAGGSDNCVATFTRQ